MIKLKSLPIIALSISTFTASPTLALTRQQSQPSVTETQRTELATSWGDLRDNIRRRRRTGGSRGEICEITPAPLVNPNSTDSNSRNIQEIWSDRPLFIWQIPGGTAKKIDLFIQGSEQPFWSREIPDGERKILYDGEPLQPGKTYEWQLSANAPFPITSAGVSFQVMEPQKRDRISAELISIALVQQLKDPSPEALVMEKAAYFAERELWADVLQEIYSVPNPSAELMSAIAQIQSHNFCNTDQPNSSASR